MQCSFIARLRIALHMHLYLSSSRAAVSKAMQTSSWRINCIHSKTWTCVPCDQHVILSPTFQHHFAPPLSTMRCAAWDSCCPSNALWLFDNMLPGVVQDLDLPPEMVAETRAPSGQESQFVAPTPGVTPSQRWLQKCSLAADHVAAGDFASAMRLLNRYLLASYTFLLQPSLLQLNHEPTLCCLYNHHLYVKSASEVSQ